MRPSTHRRAGVFTSLLGAASLALALMAPGVGADTDEAPGRSGDTAAAENRQDGRGAGSEQAGTEAEGQSGDVRQDGEARAATQPVDPGAQGRERAAEAQDSDDGNGSGANNRGTVKIKTPGEDAFPPANRPHPGCDFEVHVYNASSEGATLTFTLHAPTAGGSVVENITGLDVAGPGDGLVHSGFEAFNLIGLFGDELDGVEPHPQQGYHVKLTLEWDRDTPPANVKHKVFWLDCPPPGEEPNGENGNGNGSGENGNGENGNGLIENENGNGLIENGVIDEEVVIQPEVLPQEITAPQPEVAPQLQLPEAAPEPLAVQPAQPEVAPQVLGVEQRRQLPVTGGDAPLLMILAGLVLLAGGTLLTVESQLNARRRPARSRV